MTMDTVDNFKMATLAIKSKLPSKYALKTHHLGRSNLTLTFQCGKYKYEFNLRHSTDKCQYSLDICIWRHSKGGDVKVVYSHQKILFESKVLAYFNEDFKVPQYA